MIEIENLVKVFAQGGGKQKAVHGLDDVSISVEEGEFFVLLGPSGSGKTTCLRMLAGLDRPTSGRIKIDGVPVYDSGSGIWVGPETRPQAMVFQSYALWPHMTVYKNIEFPLRHGARKVSSAEARRRVENVVGLLDLEPLVARKITQLSGGQQQRVALARALALEPKVLLMDEPLSNLDVELRSRVRDEIKRLTTRLNITSILVTHDQEEALAMGDKVAVLNKGRVEQVGPPEVLYRGPASRFVANFLDKMNLLDGNVIGWNAGVATVQLDGDAQIRVPSGAVASDSRVLVGVRPNGFSLSQTADSTAFTGVIEAKVFLGSTYRYDVNTNAGFVVVKGDINDSHNVGDRVYLSPLEHATAIVGVS